MSDGFTTPGGAAVKTPRSAFTLVELVIVCLVCAILAAVAGPKYLNAYNKSRVNSAAQRIKADVEYTRQRAVALSQSHTVQFNTTLEQYSLLGVTDTDHSARSYIVALGAVPYQVNVTTAVFGAGADLVYDLHGIPTSGGVVTVQSGGYTQTVTVNADTGNVSVP